MMATLVGCFTSSSHPQSSLWDALGCSRRRFAPGIRAWWLVLPSGHIWRQPLEVRGWIMVSHFDLIMWICAYRYMAIPNLYTCISKNYTIYIIKFPLLSSLSSLLFLLFKISSIIIVGTLHVRPWYPQTNRTSMISLTQRSLLRLGQFIQISPTPRVHISLESSELPAFKKV